MNVNYFRRLYDYTFWAHRQVWACVMLLTEEQFTRHSTYSVGSVHEQVLHTLSAEWVWLERVRGVSPTAFLNKDDFPTREVIRTKWDTVEADWHSYLAHLHESQLTQPLIYRGLDGGTHPHTPLWEILAHVVNHGTDHRAQTLALIHQVGGSTLEQDILFFSWRHD